MTDPDEIMMAVIERDGFINKHPDIPLRSAEDQA
jgi:hypothetical protein